MDAIHVIGAGGIGCAVGYALRASGVPVVLVDANPAKVETGRRDGVRVDDRSPLPAEFEHFDDWRPVPHSRVLLCTKCYDNAAVLARLAVPVSLIPIQNGFDPQLAAFGHAFEGIASFVSECDRDRPHTRITRRGALHAGPRDHDTGTRGESSSWLRGLSSSFRVIEVADISPVKHTKLMYNAAISPIAAVAGIDNGKLLSLPEARALFFALLQENHAILRASGTELGKVGPFHPRTVAWILRRRWLAGLLAKCFEPSLRGTYCSMAGEIPRGRTEIDNYNGHLIRLAECAGVPCPLNRAVHDLVVRMSATRELPGRDRLALLARGYGRQGTRPPGRPLDAATS